MQDQVAPLIWTSGMAGNSMAEIHVRVSAYISSQEREKRAVSQNPFQDYLCNDVRSTAPRDQAFTYGALNTHPNHRA